MKELLQEYTTILKNHLKDPNEAHLFQGYSFGKKCAEQDISMSKLVSMHFDILKAHQEWLSDVNFADSQALLLEVSLAMSISGGMKTMENVLAALYDESVMQFKELSEVKQQLNDYALNLEEKVQDKLHELELAEERFKILVETIPDIVYKIDPDGNFVYLNQAIIALGYDPQELIGRHFSEIIFPDELEMVSSSSALPKYAGKTIGDKDAPKLFDERRTGERKTIGLEVRLLLKSGKVVQGALEPLCRGVIVVELSSSGMHSINPITKKKVFIGTVGVVRDISERKKAEGKLRSYHFHLEQLVAERTTELSTANKALQSEVQEHKQSIEFAENIMKSMDEGLVVIDHNYKIISANRAYSEQINKPIREIIGAPCYAMSHSRDQPCHIFGEECPVNKTFITGKPHTAVHEHIGQNGNILLVEIRSYPMQVKSGQTISAIEVINNITEKKKLEDELLQAHKMEAIGTLAGGIAHDFNNILAVILGYADVIKGDLPDGSQAQEDINQVLKAANRATKLVKQILTFSRKGQDTQLLLQPTPIINEALKLMRASLPTTIEIHEKIDPNCGSIMANPTNVHRILVNLCTNALHGMEDEKGILTVHLTRVELREHEVMHEPGVSAGSFVELMVSDTGCGMNKRTIKRIFEPYFTTKEVGKGTGMGLALVHGIIQSYRGFIRVESELNTGTTFHVYFPAIEEKAVTCKKEKQKSFSKGNERIMAIDDEKAIADMYRATLERLGYKVSIYSSSEKAFEVFQSAPDNFDLIITDQTMPHLSGSDLAKKILQIRPDMPIILCTGYSAMISEDQAQEIGIKQFVMKPVSPPNLAMTIRDILDKSQS